MKNIFYFIVIFAIACNSNEQQNNRAPESFRIENTIVNQEVATISWSQSVDPDGDNVQYIIELEGKSIATINRLNYTFTHLTQNKTYQGFVTATDGKGGNTKVDFSFTTSSNGNNSTSFNIPSELKSYYKDVDFSKRNQELRDALATLTIGKHATFLKYPERHAYLYKADRSQDNENQVVLLYTGEKRYWKEYEGSNYHPQTFNTEHVYPRSKIESTAQADLHHLRACDTKVNSNRGNLPFTQGQGQARQIGGGWYPGDEWKGDVARMVLYLNIRYNENMGSDISTGSIELLLKWNAEDPVSYIEKNRNNVIEAAQGNRNPFIDNPYLATLIWGEKSAENRWK
ncbi:endonuclease [Capnocytophaga canimorsus]|uniref:endonuclease n=1 Tax=Capnocytophaga canimorsus TaxID=28188 RepID=UPI00384ABBC3